MRQVLLQSATYYYQVRQNMTTDTRRPICHQMTILSKYGHFTSQLKRTKKFFSRRRKWRQNPASCPQILGNPVSRHAEFGGCYQPRPKINLLWRKNEAANVFTVPNLPYLNSVDFKSNWSIIQYNTVLAGLSKYQNLVCMDY